MLDTSNAVATLFDMDCFEVQLTVQFTEVERLPSPIKPWWVSLS